MQAPLAATVLTLELAHQTETLMVPLLLAVVGATVVARLIGAPSIYSARLGEKAGEERQDEPRDGAGREMPDAAPKSDDQLLPDGQEP
jgi:H+/Cl- antiporter ClcA